MGSKIFGTLTLLSPVKGEETDKPHRKLLWVVYSVCFGVAHDCLLLSSQLSE